MALIGGFALAAAIILLLVDPVGLEPWVAALLVGVLLAGGGYVMLQKGLRDLKTVDRLPAARWRASRKTSRPSRSGGHE